VCSSDLAARTVAFRPTPCTNVEIWVDGERLGVYGPPPGLLSRELPAGEHRFEYRPLTVNCYPESWTETIHGGTDSHLLARRLRLRPGTLTVNTGGVDATVDVVGRANGRANEPIEIPFETQDGIALTLRVVVTFPGRAPVSRRAVVRAGEAATLEVAEPDGAGADGS
jgi:hypothetical protein